MSRTYLILLSLAVLTALLLFSLMQMEKSMLHEGFIPSDVYTYMSSADLLYQEAKPHPTRPLGYAALLGLPSLFIGQPTTAQYVYWALALNAIAWLITILFLYKTLRLMSSPKAAAVGAGFFIFCLGNMFHISLALTETTTCLFLTLSGWFFVKNLQTKNSAYLFHGAAMLNISLLFRPGMFYFALLVSVALAVFALIKKRKNMLQHPVWLLSLVLVTVQLTAMYQSYGKFTPSFVDKATWYFYLGAEAEAKAQGHRYEEEVKQRRASYPQGDWKALSRLSKEDMAHQLSSNTGILFQEYFSNVIENAHHGSHPIKYAQQVNNRGGFGDSILFISRIQNVLLFLAPLIVCIGLIIRKKRPPLPLLLMLGTVLYIIATSGVSFWQGDRFFIVFYPLVIVLGLYTWNLLQKSVDFRLQNSDLLLQK
ncbi:MAG: glycosyltransferase family 39 protein [Bacteroidia bacterium]